MDQEITLTLTRQEAEELIVLLREQDVGYRDPIARVAEQIEEKLVAPERL